MQFALVLIAGILGIIVLVVGFRGGVFGASEPGEVDPSVRRVFNVLGVLVLVFILLGGLWPSIDSWNTSKSAAIKKQVPPNDRTIDEWFTAIEARLKEEPVPSGTSKLFILKPADLQTADKYRSIRVFLMHLSEKNIPSKTKTSSDGEVVVFENLDKKYIEQWLPVFEELKIRAWHE